MRLNNQTYNEDELLTKALSFIYKLKEVDLQSKKSRMWLVKSTAIYLRTILHISLRTAIDTACKALCEYEYKQNKGAYVDVNKTTSFCIVINDPSNNVTRYISIKDINEMIQRTHFTAVKIDDQLVSVN